MTATYRPTPGSHMESVLIATRDAGECDPATVAARSGVSVETVRYALQLLYSAGLLMRVRRGVYRNIEPRLADPWPFSPGSGEPPFILTFQWPPAPAGLVEG